MPSDLALQYRRLSARALASGDRTSGRIYLRQAREEEARRHHARRTLALRYRRLAASALRHGDRPSYRIFLRQAREEEGRLAFRRAGRPWRYEAHHAPAGGVEIAGRRF